MSEQFINISEREIAISELFRQALERGELPEEITPELFTEILDFPNHFPDLRNLIQQLGKDSRLTYKTEAKGRYVGDSDESRNAFAAAYAEAKKNQLEFDKRYAGGKPFNTRLWVLCQTVAGGEPTHTHKLYYLMLKAGSACQLSYELTPQAVPWTSLELTDLLPAVFKGRPTTLNPNQVGDFSLLARFIYDHLDQFDVAIITNSGSDERNAANISRGKEVTIQTNSLRNLLKAWQSQLGGISPHNVNLDPGKLVGSDGHKVEKGKLHSSSIELFPRAGTSSIVRRFEELFVTLDLHDLQAIQKTLGFVAELDEDNRQFFAAHVRRVELILLGLVADTKQKGPIKNLLDRTTTPAEPSHAHDALQLLQEFATTTPDQGNKPDLHGIEQVNSGNFTPIAELEQLSYRLDNCSKRSFGVAQALLVQLSEAKLQATAATVNNRWTEAADYNALVENLEKLMHWCTLLVTNPVASDALGLDEAWTQSD